MAVVINLCVTNALQITDDGDYGVLTAMNQAQSGNFFDTQRIRMGEVYTTNDLVQLLHVKKETVLEWYKFGLEYTPTSLSRTAKRFVNGTKVIEFLNAYGLALRIISMMGLNDGEEETEEEA